MVLPYIIAFYLRCALLEDTGYLPRLATVTDNVFHRLGMHGHGINPFCWLWLQCAGAFHALPWKRGSNVSFAATLVSVTVPWQWRNRHDFREFLDITGPAR